jgi:hypothetical protein
VRFNLQISGESSPKQRSADHILIAGRRKFEALGSRLLFRIKLFKQQRAGCFFPGDKINLPDMDFVSRQDAIGMPQGIGVHRLRYHGPREAANLLFEDGGLDNLCITIGVIQPNAIQWFISPKLFRGLIGPAWRP